jgi:serine phosphatase RsbU (regulator of sigma subunit)
MIFVITEHPMPRPGCDKPLVLQASRPALSSLFRIVAVCQTHTQMFALRLRPLSAGVVGIGVALTLGLTWVTNTVNTHNNDRLLAQQVQQTAAAISSALPVVQSQLVDAVQVGIDTNGDAQTFQRFVAAGTVSTGNAGSISLWRLTNGHAQEISNIGPPLALVDQHLDGAFFATVHPSATLFVTGILPGPSPRLGYAEMPTGDTSGFMVYRETSLPADRRVALPASSPFSQLKFALYLGSKPDAADLLEATGSTPIRGRTSSTSLPFGDTFITMVGSSTSQLSGGLSAALEWIVLGVGLALALGSGAAVEYALRRRLFAESLARDNGRLYREQQNIAGYLQHALLPRVPEIEGVEIAARYLAGVVDIEVGGDWYDVISIGNDRCVFFVGDVSGRGLQAATTMASLRYAIRAYTAQGDDVATVLVKLSALLDIEADQQFATVLAGEIDVGRHRVTLVSAGHFMPLVIRDGVAEFIEGPAAPPVGVTPLANLTAVTFDVPPKATLIAFTDGLIERKDDESIDVGLERLRVAATGQTESVAELVDELVNALIVADAPDDTVILAIRWRQ